MKVTTVIIFFSLYLYGLPLFATNYTMEAKKYLAQGELQAAVIQLKNHLKLYPNDALSRHLLGTIYIKKKKLLAAEKELYTANHLAPNNAIIVMDYAKVLLILEKYKKIIKLLNKEYSIADMEGKRLVLIAKAYQGLQQLDLAKLFFQLAVAKGNINANTDLANMAFLKKDFNKANILLDKVLSKESHNTEALKLTAIILNFTTQSEQALEIYQQLLRDHPELYNLYLQRAITYMALQNFTKAEHDLQIFLKAKKKDIHAYYLMAKIKLEQNKYQQARRAAEQAINIKANHYPSIFILGIAHYRLKNFNQAKKYLSQYLSFQADDKKAQLLLARIYLSDKESDKGVNILDRLLYAEADNLNLLIAVAELYSATGKHSYSLKLYRQAKKLDPDNITIKKGLIREQLQLRDINNAINELKSYSSLQNNSIADDNYLVLAYITQGKYQEAEQELNHLISINSHDPLLYIFRADIENYHLNYKKAKKAYQQALAINKNYIPALMGLAKYYNETGKPLLAQQNYQKVIALNKQHIAAWLALIDISQQENNKEAQERLLLSAYSNNKGILKHELELAVLLSKFYITHHNLEKAQWLANDLLDNNPDTLEAESFMVDTFILLSASDKAEQLLRKIIKNHPEKTNYQANLANLLIQQGDRDSDAKQILNTLFNKKGQEKQILTALINLYRKNKYYKKALKTARRITDLFSDSNTGKILEGDILRQTKQYQQALLSYQQAYKKVPDNTLAIKISDILLIQDKRIEAIKLLTQQLNHQTNNLYILFRLAEIHQAQAEYKQALGYYQQLLTQQPDNAILLNNIAWLYLLNNNPEAESFAHKAYQKNPDSAAIADTYGVILLANKKQKEALDILKHAAHLENNAKEIQFHLAQAYHSNGEIQKSIIILQKLVSDNKEFSLLIEASKLLKELQK